MSLVGPRPPLPEEVSRYEPWQRRRLCMKPGLTCLWQVSGRSELDFDRWMALDLKYIDTWSPMLDLKILLKTVPAVLSGRGAQVTRGLESQDLEDLDGSGPNSPDLADLQTHASFVPLPVPVALRLRPPRTP